MHHGDAIVAGELTHGPLNLRVDLQVDLRLAIHEILLLKLGVDTEITLSLCDLGFELLIFRRTHVESLELLHEPVDAVTLALEGVLGGQHLVFHLVHRGLESRVVLEDVTNVDHGHVVCGRRRPYGGSRSGDGLPRNLGVDGGLAECHGDRECERSQLPVHGMLSLLAERGAIVRAAPPRGHPWPPGMPTRGDDGDPRLATQGHLCP